MLKLHFAPNSRAGRILWLLEELELPYELNAMAFHPKDLKSDEHRSRHPLGRIPVLDDGDVSIYESGAIVEQSHKMQYPMRDALRRNVIRTSSVRHCTENESFL